MKKNIQKSGGPFACIILDSDGFTIGSGENQVILNNDPTAHAEIVAIRNACKHINNFMLSNCVLFTSCEPCPMCLSAIYGRV
jgi:guanine deaminase